MSFEPAPVPAHASPRLRASAGNEERLAAGASAAATLSRSRELYPSRRLSPEQRELRETMRAQEHVGKLLEPLERRGAHVLHARRAPRSAFDLDHIIVTAGAVLVVVDVTSSRQSPVNIDEFGSLTRSGIPLARQQDLVRGSAEDVAVECGRSLPSAWSVLVVPVMVVVGSSALTSLQVSRGLTVVQQNLLVRWTINTFPPTVDLVGAAQIAAAIETSCPSAA